MADSKNRVIAVVTGANGGLGFAICQILLQCLSVPSGQKVYETTPVISSIHPSLTESFPSAEALVKGVSDKTAHGPTYLTLVLVCRSKQKGEQTRSRLLAEHERLLEDRARKGVATTIDWWHELQIEVQTCDQSTPGGDNGVLALCRRLKQTLPYITLLFLNAAHAQLLGNDYVALTKQVLLDGPIEAFTRPKFMREETGVLTGDEQRGMVWSTNVLSGYIMSKELVDLLAASPKSLPFAPRIVHTSSRTAEFQALQDNVSIDPQLVKAPKSYAASKYLATLLTARCDQEFAQGERTRRVRCVNVDPGAVRTNVMDGGFHAEGAGFAIYVAVMRWGYWLAFLLCKYVLGSTWHPGSPENASLAMVYAAVLDPQYLAEPDVSPGPVFQIWARRWARATVAVREVDHLAGSDVVAKSQVQECDRIWQEWKSKLDPDVL